MSESEHAEPVEHGAVAVASPFSDAEVAAFREDDKIAAKNFVGLMLAIFVVGVILYSIVAYICAGGQ